MYLLQFCDDLSKKSTSIRAIYMYAAEKSCYALSENGIVHYNMTYCFGDIRVWSQRILLNVCWVSIFFDVLIAYISWTVTQTTYSFLKDVMRTFRCIYVNCFNRLKFLAEVSSKLQKIQFLDNLRTITQERNIEARHMNPFSSTFSAFTVCNIHFCIWKWEKFIFMWSLCLVCCGLWNTSILGKSNHFRQPIIRTAHHTFLERRIPVVTKNPDYVLYPLIEYYKKNNFFRYTVLQLNDRTFVLFLVAWKRATDGSKLQRYTGETDTVFGSIAYLEDILGQGGCEVH